MLCAQGSCPLRGPSGSVWASNMQSKHRTCCTILPMFLAFYGPLSPYGSLKIFNVVVLKSSSSDLYFLRSFFFFWIIYTSLLLLCFVIFCYCWKPTTEIWFVPFSYHLQFCFVIVAASISSGDQPGVSKNFSGVFWCLSQCILSKILLNSFIGCFWMFCFFKFCFLKAKGSLGLEGAGPLTALEVVLAAMRLQGRGFNQSRGKTIEVCVPLSRPQPSEARAAIRPHSLRLSKSSSSCLQASSRHLHGSLPLKGMMVS